MQKCFAALLLALCLSTTCTLGALAEEPADTGTVQVTAESMSGQNEGGADEDPAGSIVIDEAHFPDETFRAYVQDTLDPDGDRSLTLEERSQVTEICVSNMNIADLTGVASFPKLERLQADGNLIRELDISQNTELVDLDVSGNLLKELDISQNTKLLELDVHLNPLTELNVDNNPLLKKLNCYNSDLTEIDLTNLGDLDTLIATDSDLESLDVSNNHKLSVLLVAGNKFPKLDISNNPGLRELKVNNLDGLDISHNLDLEVLDICDTPLGELDLSKHTKLQELYCSGCGLTAWDLSSQPDLNWLHVNDPIESIDLSKN